MAPKEKAQELIHKYQMNAYRGSIPLDIHVLNIKKNALIAVDELIEAFKEFSIQESGRVNIDFGHGYWEDVKAEIENI